MLPLSKLAFVALFCLAISAYVPFDSSYNVTSLTFNIATDDREGCAKCSLNGIGYANLDNLPPYQSSNFTFAEYPNGICQEKVRFSWTPENSDTFSFLYQQQIVGCSTTAQASFSVPLPAVIYDSYGVKVTLVQINRCPENTFYCGVACCDVGTVCSNPSTGQCCAGTVNTC